MHHARRVWLGGLVCAVLVVALATAGWAAEPAAGEHGGGLISLDKSLIVQGINFLILLLLLWRLAYKPLLAKMEERSEAIRRSLDEAQAARTEAARQQEENAARLREAHAEAARIRAQALGEAQNEARKQIAAAQAQSRKLVDDTKAQLDAEIRRARDELRREVADLATSVAEKLVRRSLREEDHRRVVADAVARLGR
ncbi:MAG: F0F1 ATP synthase subunit B [Candidatus Rokuibacteriota bacterium]